MNMASSRFPVILYFYQKRLELLRDAQSHFLAGGYSDGRVI